MAAGGWEGTRGIGGLSSSPLGGDGNVTDGAALAGGGSSLLILQGVRVECLGASG